MRHRPPTEKGISPFPPRTRPDKVWGDKAYGFRANRAYLRRRRIT
ncbi:hypothetical protein [Streptosporangium jomthongense]|uniref:Transposase n=1 Tax=Streptosporangium jomthongense TaxID=1193683 RepID=A0ABV8F581_9ACTN